MDNMGTVEHKALYEETKEIVEHRDIQTSSVGQPVSPFDNLTLSQTAKVAWKAVLISCMVAVGAIFDAYAISIPGSIIANPGFIAVFGSVGSGATLALDADHVAAWGGVQSGGQIVGMLIGPIVSDTFGRKICMWALTVLLIVGIVLEVTSTSWVVYTVAKLIAGMATGLTQSGLTVYIAEIAPTKIRGALLANYSFFFALGQLAASIGLQVIAVTNPTAYKMGFYSQFVFVGMFLPALVFAPESPWYHARKGNEGKAKKSLTFLFGNIAGYDVDHEYSLLAEAIREEQELHAGGHFKQIAECFKGTNLRRTIISFLPLAFQQFLGIALIFGYSTYFFQLSGFAEPFLASLIISLILLVFIVISFFVVDKFGRRPLLLGGGLVMGCCTFAIGGIGFKQVLPGQALVALCAIWVAAYALSAGPLGWTYVADTATPRLRAKTAGLSAAGTCMFGLIFNYTVPLMLSPQKGNWGIRSGLFWGGMTAIGLVILFFTVPEMKGRTFAETDEMFEKKIPTRKFGTFKTDVQLAREGQEA